MFYLKKKRVSIIILTILFLICKGSAKIFFSKGAFASNNTALSKNLHGASSTGDIPVIINDRVLFYIRYYTKSGRKYFASALNRSYRYKEIMQGILMQFNLPKDLFYLAFIESNFDNHAYSRSHACGPWQLIAETAIQYGIRIDHWVDERKDPVLSTKAAAKYLSDLYKRFGCWYLTAAAYNAGGGTIKRLIKKYNTNDWWILSKRARELKRETKDYVPKWIATIIIAKNPERYGFSPPKTTPLRYDVIKTNTILDLEKVAHLCKISLKEIKRLNPALKRIYTPPYPYFLRIPEGKKESLLASLKRQPRLKIDHFYYYRVRPRDTLWDIARHYRSSIPLIARLNNLSPPYLIRPGQMLLVPRLKRK